MSDARSAYLEQYASTMVTNNYLKVAVAVQSILALGLVGFCFWIFFWAKEQKPLVVRIDEVGRATVVDYRDFSYRRPEAPELRYFLGNFVQLHFSRLLGAVDRNFGKSLFFLDAPLSRAIYEEERKTQSLAAFLREGAEEIDIDIHNIVLQDIRSSPMKAAVDFERVFLARGERREVRRERATGSFEFVVQKDIPSNFVLVNPLGLTITYFRVDSAFRP